MHYTRERVEAMTTGGGYASDWLCADWLELDAALAEARQTMIEPLVQSDDPDVAEAVRVTPDYVLMTPAAYAQERGVWERRWTEARQEHAALAARVEAADKVADEAQDRYAQLAELLFGENGANYPHDAVHKRLATIIEQWADQTTEQP